MIEYSREKYGGFTPEQIQRRSSLIVPLYKGTPDETRLFFRQDLQKPQRLGIFHIVPPERNARFKDLNIPAAEFFELLDSGKPVTQGVSKIYFTREGDDVVISVNYPISPGVKEVPPLRVPWEAFQKAQEAVTGDPMRVQASASPQGRGEHEREARGIVQEILEDEFQIETSPSVMDPGADSMFLANGVPMRVQVHSSSGEIYILPQNLNKHRDPNLHLSLNMGRGFFTGAGDPDLEYEDAVEEMRPLAEAIKNA